MNKSKLKEAHQRSQVRSLNRKIDKLNEQVKILTWELARRHWLGYGKPDWVSDGTEMKAVFNHKTRSNSWCYVTFEPTDLKL